MGKFIIECPHCGTYQTASTSFFARKVLECKCGKTIEIKGGALAENYYVEVYEFFAGTDCGNYAKRGV